MSGPRRRVVLEVKIGADSWRDMAHALGQIEHRMLEAAERDEDSIECTSGGPDWGGSYSGDQDRSVTHESYFAEVETWLAAERSKRGATVEKSDG